MNHYDQTMYRVTKPTQRSTPTRVMLYALIGVLLGLACGFFGGLAFDMRAVPAAAILGALGYAIGSYRAPSKPS
jgi:hypothetical protein